MKCTCRFVSVGLPMDNGGWDKPRCKVHPKSNYRCERTHCDNYRPAKPKVGDGWPRCVCGEIAQEHD